jgi:uncharacterized protein (DUF1800 family)
MALTTDRERVAHLLRRAGLGASRAELERLVPLGVAGAVDELLAYQDIDEGLDVDYWELRDERKRIPAQLAGAWWTYRLLVTRRPLQERMTLFWHNHFGCSLEKVKASMLFKQHLDTIRANSTADFRTLLIAVAQDPTMLVFLDGKDNKAGSPNENFARELMELYTLGEGHYTEQDIKEAARAFTGWSIERHGTILDAVDDGGLPSYRFRPAIHDTGAKTCLGLSGNWDGVDIIDMLLEQPQHAEFICRKLWRWFAYPEPETEVLGRMVRTYRASGGNIAATLRWMFNQAEFYGERAERAIYKSPVDFCIAALRALDAPGLVKLARETAERRTEGPQRKISPLAGYAYRAMQNMGMQLMFPPSVAGWDGGEAWVNSATMLERIRFAGLFDPDANKGRMIRWQFILGRTSPSDVQAAIDFICDLFDAPLPSSKRDLIAQATEGQTGQQRALYEICRLVFASPEFQFC